MSVSLKKLWNDYGVVGVLIAIISDDTIQYVDNCLDFYCAEIEDS